MIVNRSQKPKITPDERTETLANLKIYVDAAEKAAKILDKEFDLLSWRDPDGFLELFPALINANRTKTERNLVERYHHYIDNAAAYFTLKSLIRKLQKFLKDNP